MGTQPRSSINGDAIVFRHVFPPNHGSLPTTFFGGTPRAPNGFKWPRRPYRWLRGGSPNRPATFLGQVDCADIRRTGLTGILPDDGALLFFLHWELLDGEDGDATTTGLVQHVPGDPRAWTHAAPPADLPPCYGEHAGYEFEWLRHTDRSSRGYPTTFSKWAMQPRLLRTEALAGASESKRADTPAMRAAFGKTVDATQILFAPRDNHNRVWRPFSGFPHAWLAVEVFAGLLCDPHHTMPTKVQQKSIVIGRDGDQIVRGLWPADPVGVAQEYAAVRAGAKMWIERARSGGLHKAVLDSDKAAFWAWLDGMHAAATHTFYDERSAYNLNKHLEKAAFRSVNDCLAHSRAAAALVPDAAREGVRHRHAFFVSGDGRTAGRHQMLGAGRNVQGAPDRFRDSHVLLMQFDSDYGLNWMFGDCGVSQYWITPDDLARRRFDRARVTFEGH